MEERMAATRKAASAKPATRGRGNGRGSKSDIKRLAEQARTLTDREARREVQATLAASIFEMREDREMSWMEISEELGWGDSNATGRMQWLYFQEDVRRNPDLAITAKNRQQLGQKIVRARDNGHSWGKIAAYADISEQFAKNLYEEVSGLDPRDSSIGKGGRRVGDGRGNLATSSKASSKTAAKKTTKRGRPAVVEVEEDEDETPAKPAARRGRAAGPQRPTAAAGKAASKRQPAAGGARRPATKR
jgi:hypothetical protein